MADEIKNGRVFSLPVITLFGTVIVTVVSFSLWIGALQREVSNMKEWIVVRHSENMPERLAILETRQIDGRERLAALEAEVRRHDADDQRAMAALLQLINERMPYYQEPHQPRTQQQREESK